MGAGRQLLLAAQEAAAVQLELLGGPSARVDWNQGNQPGGLG